MVVDERARRALHQQLEIALGAPAADTLMESLPPLGWAEVASRSDVAALGARFDGLEYRFDAIDQRFIGMEHRFDAIDQRFEAIDQRFIGINHRFDAIDQRFSSLEHTFEASIQSGLAGVRTEMAAQTRTLVFALIAAATSFGGLVLAAARLG